jgi:molybdenum cofactor biosynthesis enzyme
MPGARLARRGIQAAKRSSSLISLWHPLSLSDIDVEVTLRQDRVEISATVAPLKRTGAKLKTLTACAVATPSVIHSLLEQ